VAGLLSRFWPGPLTVVVPRSDRAGDHITGAQETVALRCPGHPVALAALVAFAELTGDPSAGVAAPSANRFGRVSPTTAADVLAELAPRLRPGDLVVDGGPSRVGVESTIVDCTAGHPRVLRPGAIGAAELSLAWDAGSEAPTTQPAANVRVPGTLAAHYAPRVRLITTEEPAIPQLVAQLAAAGVDPGRCALLAERAVADLPGWTRLAAPADAAGYASVLYGALRRADELDLEVVVAVLPSSAEPLGGAVRDRLLRAGVGSGR
jgi:L-threonylcarbamoyladenylate synthase